MPSRIREMNASLDYYSNGSWSHHDGCTNGNYIWSQEYHGPIATRIILESVKHADDDISKIFPEMWDLSHFRQLCPQPRLSLCMQSTEFLKSQVGRSLKENLWDSDNIDGGCPALSLLRSPCMMTPKIGGKGSFYSVIIAQLVFMSRLTWKALISGLSFWWKSGSGLCFSRYDRLVARRMGTSLQ